MIEVRDLVIKYDDETVLNNFSLHLEKNKTCAIIGPSGCGKSTLLYSLSGLVQPSSGEISIQGNKVVKNRKETALILQNNGLFPWKTVWENVTLGLKIRGVSEDILVPITNHLLEKLGIYQLKNKYPIQLSGGQKQRVAIARALSIEPDLLLMDEPFSALDAITRETLQNVILDLFQETKMTTILVTHNIEEAVFLGQKIVIMNKKSSVKKTIDNAIFGKKNLRYSPKFFEMCTEIRRLLEEFST